MKPHKPIPLVLCEGKEDRLVMEMLAKHAGLGGKLAFQDYGGESKLALHGWLGKQTLMRGAGVLGCLLLLSLTHIGVLGASAVMLSAVMLVFIALHGVSADWRQLLLWMAAGAVLLSFAGVLVLWKFDPTRISQVTALRPDDWQRYREGYFLEVKSGLQMPQIGPPGAGKPGAVPPMLSNGVNPFVSAKIPPDAQVLHDGACLEFARIP